MGLDKMWKEWRPIEFILRENLLEIFVKELLDTWYILVSIAGAI